MKPITIYLADDHVLLRDGLAKIINEFPSCEVIGSGSHGADVLAALKNGLQPKIIILDVNMPVMDGYETAKELKESYPAIRTMVLTMFDTEVSLVRLLQLGVRGILKKDISGNDLEKAIYSVAENGYYYCNSYSGILADFFKTDSENNSSYHKGIVNDLEISFLKLAATDLTYKEIASALGLPAGTMESLRLSLFGKLNVRSRVGLVIYAVKNGIVSF